MSLIQIQDLSFGYDGSSEMLFEHVHLQLDTAWRLGLTGRNGRGKTTLLRLLMGELEYTGKITASTAFEYFPYPAEADALAIDVIEGMAPDAAPWQIRRELHLLQAEEALLYQPFGMLSGGEQTKLRIAAMFLRENSFLLIDEPTNHLDAQARVILGEYLQKKSGFILISHDRAFLDTCIDHILVIHKASIQVQKGNFTTWNENHERQEQFERTQNERLKKEIRQLQQAAEQHAAHAGRVESEKIGFDPSKTEKSISRRPYLGKKSEKLMRRAKALESRTERHIAEKSQLLRDTEEAPPLKLTPLKYHSGQLAVLHNVSLCYEGRTIFQDVSFAIHQGDRIALCGPNGCGKSSLLRLIAGESLPCQGTIAKGSGLKISYVCQSADGLQGSLDDYIRSYQADETLVKAILRKLDFDRALFTRPMESYSQGQKKKVMLARSLSEQAHLYIWDEPLNYMDILSRMQLEALLRQSAVTILFAEHDQHFCQQTATTQIQLGLA